MTEQMHTQEAATPYAFEYGRSNGDGTFSVVIERGEPKKPVSDWPVKPLYAAPAASRIAQLEKALEKLISAGLDVTKHGPTRWNYRAVHEAYDLARAALSQVQS